MPHFSGRSPLKIGTSLIFALALGLSACGGGTGDTKSTQEPAAAKTTAAPAPAEEPTKEAPAEEPTKEAPAATPSAGSEGYGGEEMTPGEKANENFKNKVSDEELLKGLKAGGYVVFIRHGQTEKDYADQADPKMDVNNCSTQRTLSEKGWKQAIMIGAAFKKASIPVGKVTSSEYCRAWQTAELAFGKYEKNGKLNFAKAEEYTDEQVKEMADGITPLLVAKPAAGTNDIIVGHDDVFEAATQIYPAPQGISYVVKPEGDKFELLAKLSPEDWEKLANMG